MRTGREGRESGLGFDRCGRSNQRKENIKAAIVVGGGREVESSDAMLGPRFLGLGGIEGNNKLAGGCEWGGRKAKWGTMQAIPGRERRVGFPGSKSVERELGLGKEVRPAVGRKRAVDSRHDRDHVVFGGTNRLFRREGVMVLGRNVFVGDVVL
jgi:hypothetical protein